MLSAIHVLMFFVAKNMDTDQMGPSGANSMNTDADQTAPLGANSMNKDQTALILFTYMMLSSLECI